ncbi:Gpi Mannosyltransferase 3 [Manis pentadactyla]|nr:Gpi Mannosyltransferase 3 [Manis pentadactyla]
MSGNFAEQEPAPRRSCQAPPALSGRGHGCHLEPPSGGRLCPASTPVSQNVEECPARQNQIIIKISLTPRDPARCRKLPSRQHK